MAMLHVHVQYVTKQKTVTLIVYMYMYKLTLVFDKYIITCIYEYMCINMCTCTCVILI